MGGFWRTLGRWGGSARRPTNGPAWCQSPAKIGPLKKRRRLRRRRPKTRSKMRQPAASSVSQRSRQCCARWHGTQFALCERVLASDRSARPRLALDIGPSARRGGGRHIWQTGAVGIHLCLVPWFSRPAMQSSPPRSRHPRRHHHRSKRQPPMPGHMCGTAWT